MNPEKPTKWQIAACFIPVVFFGSALVLSILQNMPEPWPTYVEKIMSGYNSIFFTAIVFLILVTLLGGLIIIFRNLIRWRP